MAGLTRSKWTAAAAAVLGILLLGSLAYIRWRALQALDKAAGEVAAEQNLGFSVRLLPEMPYGKFDSITTPAVFSRAAEFQGRLYLCGPSGLYELDSSGNSLRQFLVGKQLPPSPLTRMAVGLLPDAARLELLIVTADEGILAFDGSRFRQIRPVEAAAREINAILPLPSGRLLLGTSEKGVLVYDGKHLQPFHPSLSGVHVTALAGSDADLWVGTLSQGVFHWHGGRTDDFSESSGLPDPQVLSLLVDGERALVGTPVGVAEFQQNRFRRVIASGAFAQALAIGRDSLFIGTRDQGVVRFPLRSAPSPARFAQPIGNLDDVEQFLPSTMGLYAVARQGLYVLVDDSAGLANLIHPADTVLSAANISALSLASDGKLWVGYFDRGLDILDPAGHRIRHVENDRVFCVNRIVPLRPGGNVAVATANGLVLFDSAGNERQTLTRADGLIANDITDVTLVSNRLILATPAGITFLDPDGARSLYAFEGLFNNHVYALAGQNGQLLAGTLGGLTVLAKEQVVASYTTANSPLQRNWISALVPLDRGWMIGTYGGGIVRLDDSGRFHSYDIATADFDVNPGAMLATGHYVLAGSLGNGLYVYDRAADRWSRITQGLPSENVTALAAGDGFFYIGTDDGLVRIRQQDLLR